MAVCSYCSYYSAKYVTEYNPIISMSWNTDKKQLVLNGNASILVIQTGLLPCRQYYTDGNIALSFKE